MAALDTFQQLTAILWRGGKFCYYWTPDGKEYTDSDGNTQHEKETVWLRTDRQPRPPAVWLAKKNVYFGVNPTAEIPATNAEGAARSPKHLRARNDIVAALNCYYTELDGKDYVTEAEFLPFYVAPDLDGLTKAGARGALQRAQTAAIESAYKANPTEYKRRAYEHLIAAPLRASMAWASGGGYQAVWLFADTVPVTDENRDALRHDQRAWVHLLGGDGAACDLPRVLRVPGSVNYKPKYAPHFPEVEVLWAELDRRYSLADFRAILPAAAEKPRAERRRFHVPAGVAADLGEYGDVPILPYHPAIADYNRRTDLRTLLLELGYTDAGSGRMNRPGGNTAGVQLHGDNTASIYSSADPLFCDHRVTPAHVLCVYEHEGNPDNLLAALTGVPRPLPPMDDTQKWRLLAWAQSRAARALLREHYGIRRPDGYLRTLEALIVMAARRGQWCVMPGLRAIAETCNASHQSIAKHLTWFSGSLWQTWQTERGQAVDLALLYWQTVHHPYAKVDGTLVFDAHPYAKVDRSSTETQQIPVNLSVGGDGEECAENDAAVNLSVGVRFQHDNLSNDAFVPVAYTHGIARRLAPTVLIKSLGHAGRVAWAAILECPGISRAEIAQQSGVSARTLAKVLHQMETCRFVTVAEDGFGTKAYTLTADADDLLDRLLPDMTSYKNGVRRAELSEGSRAKWLYKQGRAAVTEAERAAIAIKMRACDTRQAALLADLAAAGIRPAKGQPRPWVRWDRKEMQREQIALAADLAAAGGSRADKLRMAEMAGWTAQEAALALKPNAGACLLQTVGAGD